jgi:ATP phosphoribosyltransferase
VIARGAAAGARGAGSAGHRPLRVVVPKGALFEGSAEALRQAGLDTSGLESPGRNLLVTGSGVEFVIAKPTDVPVYVAYGAADCGIGGKDVLLEADLDVVELVDLGFGRCRFVVAAPRGSADLAERYAHLGVLRVATKYPRITEQHFAEAGVQVEIVKLNGNIELAPLIGIADVIVDITATGTTLRQNQLVVVEDVLPSTARFIANAAALRTDDRVVELADALASQVSVKELESEARSSEPAPHGRDPRP